MTFEEELFLKFHDELYYVVDFGNGHPIPVEKLLEIADIRDRLWFPVTL